MGLMLADTAVEATAAAEAASFVATEAFIETATSFLVRAGAGFVFNQAVSACLGRRPPSDDIERVRQR